MVQQAFRVDQVSTSNIEFKSNSFISSIAADATLASNVHLVLPTSVGSSGQVLATDGSGNLSFVSQGVGGPADLVQDNVNSLTSTVDSFGVYANNTFGADGSNVSVANVTSQEFSIDGSTNTFTLVNTTDNVNKLLVSYGGIAQKPSEYAVSNTSLTLSNTRPLVAGTTVEVRYLDFEFSGSVTNSGNAGIVAGGATTVIAPFAFARVSSTTNASGTNISWSNWNSSNGTLDFTFSSAQSNTDYIVVSDAETFDDYYVGITNKTVNGFRASFYDGSGNRTPSSSAPFALIIYGATPTVDVNSLSGTSYSTTLYSNISSGVNTFNSASTPSLATYTAGKIGVYRNGVKLPATDYTATDGTSLVLNNATIEGDDIEVVNFGTVSVTLDDITDVDLTTNAPANGQALIYVSANSKWEAGSVAGSYGNSDVDTHLNQSTASTDQVLSWDGSDYAWVDQSAGGSSGASTPALTDYEFTATANQTSFAATYIPGSVQVFLNGVKLANTEFTAASGTSIVLGSNTASGDTISVSKIGGSSNLTVANASASSTGSISYDNGSEVLTYTPPDLSGYQSTLVSNTNIKTINGTSVLGSGNITISSGGGVAGTLGSLTKSFANNESSTITLSSNVSPVPNVSVFKEVPQVGFSSKGKWDVNANATNYEFFDEKSISYASSTLTPSATGDGTFTSSSPVVVEFDVANMAYNNKSYDFASQSTVPEGGGWGNNGTVFFMCTNSFNRMYSYTASTAYDISTLTYDNKYFAISSPYSDPCDVIISADGTKFWGTGRADVIVGEFVMSTAFDLSTATYNNSSLDMSAQLDGNCRSISFGDNGTKLYATGFGASYVNPKIVQYNLSTAYDLSTATYSGNSITYPKVTTAKINADGTKMLITAYKIDEVYLFTLSTAYDLSTATDSGISYNFSSIVNTTTNSTCGGTTNPDGSEFYFFGGSSADGNTYQFNMGESKAFNASDVGKKVVGNSGSAVITSTAGAYKSVTPFADTSAISSWQLFGAQGKADGSGIELSGYLTQNDIVFPTGASGSGASMVYNNNVSPTSSVFDNVRSLVFNNEGTIALLLKAGKVLRFNLSTAFDLSTMTEVTNDNFTGQLNSNQFGIAVKPDGTRIWVSDYSNDVIKQFTLSTPWSPSTQSYDGYYSFNSGGSWNSFSGGGGAPSSSNFNPFSFQFNSDGTKLLTILWDNNPYHSIAEFTLSTGWDMSTMSYTSYANLVGNSDPYAIAISADGLKLMMHGSGLGAGGIEVYSLPSAFSVGTAGTSLTRTSGAMDLSTLTGNSSNNLTYGGLSMSSDRKRMWIVYNNNSGANPIYEITGGTTSVHPYSIYSPALTKSSTGQINSSSWQDINSMTADETKNGGDIFYAVSTDNRTSWGVAKASDGVRKIVKNNSGTWQYNNDASYNTSETWVNGTNNNEHATLQEALGAQAFNRMNKAQLDAVADAYHFSQDSADTLDLMIAPYAASGTSPISDGVTINYDAEALVKQAINGTDYEAYFPSSNSVSITSLAAQNLKIRII